MAIFASSGPSGCQNILFTVVVNIFPFDLKIPTSFIKNQAFLYKKVQGIPGSTKKPKFGTFFRASKKLSGKTQFSNFRSKFWTMPDWRYFSNYHWDPRSRLGRVFGSKIHQLQWRSDRLSHFVLEVVRRWKIHPHDWQLKKK